MKTNRLFFGILFIYSFMGQKLQAQDWSNLNKFQKDNVSLQNAQPFPNRVVFMGDSITEFWSREAPEYFQTHNYINRGISGQTTPQMLVRFRADVIALKPSVVVILAGINDIAGNTGPATLDMITNNIFSMIDLAKVHNIKVILCSVLPAFDFPWRPNQKPADKIIALNILLKEYAIENAIPFVDYHSAMTNDQNGLRKTFSADGVHPNKVGYEIMAPLVENVIAVTLTK
ncbi:SGNH/GDSL hydrolase family protein [Flavobacterium sp. W22_SRS_FP1]|uniref:SGNH/GDSL hydrolase family protein n=1 Tax=Flavobacterium sp. W22_SRS_FP1 TaxID=3240276 RepID=UPI003F92F10D